MGISKWLGYLRVKARKSRDPYEVAQPVTDSEFSRRAVGQPLSLRQNPIIWQDFSREQHENENLDREGL